MNFNQAPYFDDFAEGNQHYKVLFKPGVAVQTREMNNLQSILQNQITKFGSHVFKDGSMVIPGQVNYNAKVNYLKVASTALGGNGLDWLVDKTVALTVDGTGVSAKVLMAIAAEGADPITLIVLFNGGNQFPDGTDDVGFPGGSLLYVVGENGTSVTMQSGDDASGKSAIAAQQSGVYYVAGHFVTVPETVVAVQKYVTDPALINVRVGLSYTEEIVTSQDDGSLVDNAAGTRNFTAPGADRYKINTEFKVVDIDASPTNFFELIRVQTGVVQNLVNSSNYNILEETLARRTFDESGNYVTEDFNFDVREARTNQRLTWAASAQYYVNDFITENDRNFVCVLAGQTGTNKPTTFDANDGTATILDGSVRWRYEENPTSNRGLSLNGNSSNLVLTFGLGKAYIQGFEVSKMTNTNITIDKARDIQSDFNTTLLTPVGNFMYVSKNRTYGLPDVSAGQTVKFFDRVVGDGTINKFGYGNQVGTARIQWMDYDPSGAYKVGLNDIKMESNKAFDRDVNNIAVMGSSSSAITTKTYALSGLVRYAGTTTSFYTLTGSTIFTSVTSSQYSSTGIVGGSSLTFIGSSTAFTLDLRPGDTIAVFNSSNLAISSWAVRAINSDSSILVSGSAITAGFGGITPANINAIHATTGLTFLGSVNNLAVTAAGFTVNLSTSSAIFGQIAGVNAIVFVGNSSFMSQVSWSSTGRLQGSSAFLVTARTSVTSIQILTGLSSGTALSSNLFTIQSYIGVQNTTSVSMGVSFPTLVATPGVSVLYYVNQNTSVVTSVPAGTVAAANTGTKFQTELRNGDKIYLIDDSTTANVLTVQSVFSEGRMTVTTSIAANYGFVGGVGTSIGVYYSGQSAAFSADVATNYQLGINAKKLTGLFQVLDYTGGTSTVSQHQAIRIQGTTDARMISELQQNDLLDINDNKIFVTKVSSNTIAYGISFSLVTGSTVQYPALRVSNTLKEAGNSDLLYSVTNAVSNIGGNTYSVYRTYQKNVSVGDISIQIPLTAASGNVAADQIATTDNNYFIVTQDSVGQLTTPLTVVDVSVDSGTNTLTLQLASPFTGTSARVIYPIIRSATTVNALAGVRTKTLTYDAADTFLSSSVAQQSTLALTNADVFRTTKILMATSFVAAWDSNVQTTAIDVTNNYRLDDGQRDTYYGLGAIVLAPGYPVATGSIKVFYDYFAHGTGDFFAYSSYNDSQVPYELVPEYKGISLRDQLDFRSAVNTTGITTDATTPRYGSNFRATIGYYLGRKERIFLDKNKTFYRITSASEVNPKDPVVQELNSSINLVNLTLEAYTRGTEFPYVSVAKVDNARYTMKQIGNIDKRVGALEEITSLSLLETKTKSLQVRDNKDPTLERYKTGFFVDNFTDASNADDSGDARFSIDQVNKTLQAFATYYEFPLVEKINFTNLSAILDEEIPHRQVRADMGYAVTGDLLTINYTTSTLMSQMLGTTSISVAPFLTASFIGTLKLTPDSDIFTSKQSTTKLVGDAATTAGLNAKNLALLVAALRAHWGGPYRVDTTTTNTLVGADVEKNIIPFCRANTILMVCKGLKPNTKHYAFFDDEAIGDYISGASKLTMISTDTLKFDNNRPDVKTEFARWRSPYQTIEIIKTLKKRKRVRGRWRYEYITTRRSYGPRQREIYLPSRARQDAPVTALLGGVAIYYNQGGTQGSGVIVHQDGTSLYVVNQRGYLSRQFLTGRPNQTFNYSGQFRLVGTESQHPYFLSTPIQSVSTMFTDNAKGELFSDDKGTIVALFDLPDTDVQRFLTGKKPLTLTDSVTNEPDDWISKAEAIYTSEGIQITVRSDYVSTKSYVLRPYDPIAQSFKIPDEYTAGCFITDVDVFFQAKASDYAPMQFELRLCDSTGRPSGTDLLPGTSVTLYPNDIVVDPTGGQIPTNFKFKAPVYLSPGKSYAMVLKTDTKAYRVWMATLGQDDVFDRTKTYSKNALFGSLFKSQDSTLWTEDQLSDIKFRINRAVFNKNTNAQARVINGNLPAGVLSPNPFTFTHGSNRIRVNHHNHGFREGDGVRFFSQFYTDAYAKDTTTKIFNVPITEIFGESLTGGQTSDLHSKFAVSDVDIDSYTITVSTVAFINASAVNGLSSADGGQEGVQANENSLYHVVNPAAKILGFQDTSISFDAQMLTGVTYDNNHQINTNYTASSQKLNLNTTNFLGEPKTVLTDTNEFDRYAGTVVTTGSGGSATWKDSFVGTFSMSTTNDAVSPAIDLSTLYLKTIQHRVDNPSRGTRLPAALPAVGSTSSTVIFSAIVSSNTTIAINGATESYETTTPGLFNNVMPGKYIIVSGFANQVNNNTSTGIRVKDVSPDGTKIYVDANIVTANAGDSISIFQLQDFVDERTREDASGESKYITRKINLENPASNMKVLFDVNVPSAADFDLYYKIGAAATDFDTLVWQKFYNMPNIVKNDTRGVFSEVEIDVTDFDSDGNAKDFSSFTGFQIKIVFRTTNAARIPTFQNMRVIAHA
jgi:hypothetical protein